MSDILTFIVKNIGALRPTDYALLIVFIALAATAIFIVFRKIYATRFEAQNELIALKAQSLSTLASHLELANRERGELRSQLDQRISQLLALENAGTGAPNEVRDLREEAIPFLGSKLIALTERVALAYRILFLHFAVFSSPPPSDLIALVDKFADSLEIFQTTYEDVINDKTRKKLPELIKIAQSKNISNLAADVHERFKKIAQMIQNSSQRNN